MKLLSLEIGEQFRSLHSGFKIDFHSLSEKDMYGMLEFRPFCFIGINGSGKSNVLEALASIFYHLELCVAKFKPDILTNYFREEVSNPDAYKLVYLIGEKDNSDLKFSSFKKITIEKEVGLAPKMYFQKMHPLFVFREEKKEVSLKPKKTSSYTDAAPGKAYLPDVIVGYSSGENEILSLPFIKNRLIHFDEYKEAVHKRYLYSEPENSLVYIDTDMSQAVLLSILLFESEETLSPITSELKIEGLRSFRINLNLHSFELKLIGSESNELEIRKVPILSQLQGKIDKLKSCATTWYEDKSKIWLDFFVNDSTKKVFCENFNSSFELFRFFQILYELNARVIDEKTKESVYQSKGYHTDRKLPTAKPEENVFFFLDYLIQKKVGLENKPIELLLRNISDGEHQFLHTMGICLMLKDRRTLLLLDEPETHFNPKWRAEFIKILNDSIKAGGTNNFLKDVLLTSHSPFIISDCMPDNVLFFTRNDKKLLEVKRASELGLKTYGSSVDYILKNFFETDLISSKSLGDLKDIIDHGTIDDLRKAVDSFGESSQKQFLFKKIYEKLEKNEFHEWEVEMITDKILALNPHIEGGERQRLRSGNNFTGLGVLRTVTGTENLVILVFPANKAAEMRADCAAGSQRTIVVDDKHFILVELKNFAGVFGNIGSLADNQLIDICRLFYGRDDILHNRIKR